MNVLQAAALGILQGLTEFLPVSSSGHLVLAQTFFSDFSQPGVLFDVLVHLGTSLAVLVFYFKKVTKLSLNYIKLLIIGTIPAGLVGVLFSNSIENLFSKAEFVGMTLIITAFLNLLTDRAKVNKKEISLGNSIAIGIFQAFAILPGISRSGATIFAATRGGIKRRKAAEFSFLLSVPAILGANFLQVFKYGSLLDGQNLEIYLAGFLAAFLSGLLAIKLVLGFLKKKRFIVFSLYCLVLGIFVLFFNFA